MAVDMSQYCRLCAEVSDIKVNVLQNGPVDLADTIFKYLSIKINPDDTMPISVCESCRLTMLSFEVFAMKCDSAQTQLQCLLEPKVLLEDPMWELDISNADSILNQIKSESDSADDKDFSDEDSIPVSTYTPNLQSKCTRNKIYPNCELSPKKKKAQPTQRISKEEMDDLEYVPKMLMLKCKTNATSEINGKKVNKTKTVKKTVMGRPPSAVYKYSNIAKMICHICCMEFNSVTHLKHHTKDIHSTSIHLTCVCGFILKNSSIFYAHVKRHTSENDTKCGHCNVIFPSRKVLERHFRELSSEHHQYKCDQCSKMFPTTTFLKQHQKKHLPKEVRCKFTCDTCGARFSSKNLVEKHINFVHKKEVFSMCDVCGRPFPSHGQMLAHKRIHIKENLVSCPKCPKKFKHKYTLKRHVTDCHAGTSYQCSKCPAILKSKTTLYNHQRVHDDFCKYVCGFCNKAYKRNKALKCHINRHTGNMPYTCMWCPKTFVDNSNMRDHKRKMHKKELKEYEAIHPTGWTNKNNSSTETTVIQNYAINPTFSRNTIVIPKIDIQIHQITSDPYFNT